MAPGSNRINILHMHRDQCAFIPDYYIFHKNSPDLIVIQKSEHLLSSSMLCVRSLDQKKHKASVIFLTDFAHTPTEKVAAVLLLLGASSMELKQTNHCNLPSTQMGLAAQAGLCATDTHIRQFTLL